MSRTAERVLHLLQCLVKNEEPVGLMELAHQAKLDKSTTTRLLGTLEKLDFVRRNLSTKQYTVGLGLVALASTVTRRSNLIQTVRPYLEALQQESGETVSFHLLMGKQRICVDGVEGRHTVRNVLPLGDPLELYRGTAGKAILAFLPNEEVQDALTQAKGDGLDVDHIQQQLQTLKERGYITAIGDRVAGVATISAPVFNHQGVFASITIAGPAQRWTREQLEAFGPRVKEVSILVSSGVVVDSDATGT